MSDINRFNMLLEDKVPFTMDHVGWITDDPALFEQFWCDVLGYNLVKTTQVVSELCQIIFGFQTGGTIRRYSKVGASPDIEIHIFDKGAQPNSHGFDNHGINHICLHTGGPGSRKRFVEELPGAVKVHSFSNPGGWMNYFIQDYEENWIELRESL